MKHIVLIGSREAGKSSTVDAIVKQLNPSKVYSIDVGGKTATELAISSDTELMNGTYVIEVNNKLILICAGAPSEQNIRIFVIISTAQAIFDNKISFAIVSKRQRETLSEFDKLNALSECVRTERIKRIPGTTTETFKSDSRFLERVKCLYDIVLKNL